MKLESIFLGTLFVACFSLCALVVASMLLGTPASSSLVAAKCEASTITFQAECAPPTRVVVATR